MSYARSFTVHTALGLISTLVTGVLFYGLRILLYNRLDTVEYAAFYSAMAFVMVLYPFMSIGFDPGLAPFVTQLREAGTYGLLRRLLIRVSAIESLVGFVVALVLFVLSDWLSALLIGTADAGSAFRLLGLYLAAVLLYKVVITTLLGLQCIGARAVTEVSRTAVIVGLAWWWTRSGGDAGDAAGAYVAGTTAAALVGALCLVVLRPRIAYDRGESAGPLTAQIFRDGKYASFAFGGVVIFSQMDTVMLGLLRSDNAVAIASYQVAVPTYMILYSFLLAVATNLLPMAATLRARNADETLATGLHHLAAIGAALIFPVAAGLAAFSSLTIDTLFQRTAPGAAQALAILAVGAYWNFSAFIHLNALAGTGHMPAAAKAVAIGLLTNLLLNAALVPLFNLPGAAWATVLSYMAVAAAARFGLSKTLSLRSNWPAVGAAALLGTAGGGLMLGVQHSEFFALYSHAAAIASGLLVALVSIVTLYAAGLCPIREVLAAGWATAPRNRRDV